MQTRFFGPAVALTAVVAISAGCGLTGTEPTEPSQRSGRITVGDKTRQADSVKCTQDQWALSIVASAAPGRARAFLQLGGDKPMVRTVNIENIDGLNGIAGGDSGKAEASASGSSAYTITGTAVVSDPAHPARTTDMPFKIEAPC